MRRFLTFIFICVAASLCLAGCSSKKEEPLRIWTGMDAEYPKVVELCERFQHESGIKVEPLKVPFADLRDKFLIASPAGLGPDVLMGPQDWIGVLTIAGLLAPVDLKCDDYAEVARKAVAFDNKHYSYPLCMECIAPLRNKKLMPNEPKTMQELVDNAVKIQEESHGDIKGFYFQINEFYYSLPFFTAEGAYLLGEKDGNYDITDIGIDNEGAIRAAKFLRDLRQKYKLIAPGATENLSKSLFTEGKAAVILNGPWVLKGIKDAGIDYAIDPFPVTESGGKPRPVVGVQGLMINKNARYPEEAQKLVEFFSRPENMAALSAFSGRPPVRTSAVELVSNDPDIMAFYEIAAAGVPMPTHPAVGPIWEPMKQALELIANDQISAEEELKITHGQIVQKIQLMLE